jgi:hypothetical protein
VLLATAAWGGPLVYVSTSADTLGTVDVTTGALSTIGNTGVTMYDIVFGPTAALYGLGPLGENFYTIDPSTGASTVVGPTGSSGSNLNSLAIRNDGVVFAAGINLLTTINLATGLATSIGATGFTSAGDLEFVGGQLFMTSSTNQLVSVNQSSGAGTAVGNIGFDDVLALANVGGTLYGLTAQSQVITINTSTGAGTLVTSISPNASVEGAAVPVPSAVPEPGPVVLLGTGLLGLLVWGRGRKRGFVRT